MAQAAISVPEPRDKRGDYDPAEDGSWVFNADRKQMALALAREGLPNKTIAAACKISYKTFTYVIERGRREILANEDDPSVPLTHIGEWTLNFEYARALSDRAFLNAFKGAFEKDPRIAIAYLELKGRLFPEEYGRRQVVKVEQDRTIKVVFVEKTGDGWQRGNAAVTEGANVQRQIESAQEVVPTSSTERNEIIDTTLKETENEDDNVF